MFNQSFSLLPPGYKDNVAEAFVTKELRRRELKSLETAHCMRHMHHENTDELLELLILPVKSTFFESYLQIKQQYLDGAV